MAGYPRLMTFSQGSNRPPFFLFRWLRKLYAWVLTYAESPWGSGALVLLAFAESSFFPIPPDILLVALALGAPKRALWFSALCTLGSVAGGAVGYLMGLQFYELIGRQIIDLYGVQGKYEQVQGLYQRWDALAVGIAGFTPIPYKVFTISAGAFRINFLTFLLVSLVSRGARFFLMGVLIRRFGPPVKAVIERYFNLLTILLMVLLVGGFLVLRYVID